MREQQPTEFTRQLRKKMTDAEHRLWQRLRANQIAGHKFRRQFSVPPYILDFACLEKRLAIELDGGQHAEQAVYDAQRTAFLNQQGWRVLRFWNDQVLLQQDEVLAEIWRMLVDDAPAAQSLPSPQPSPVNGRGSGFALGSTRAGRTTTNCPPLPFTGEGWGEGGEHSELETSKQPGQDTP